MNILKTAFTYRKSYRAGLLLSKAFRILKKRTNDVLAPHGINPTDWGVLGLLYESRQGLRLSEVAFEVGVKPPFVTKSVKGLIEKGYIELRVDEADTRAKLATITEAGKMFVKNTETEVMKEVMGVFEKTNKRDLIGYVNTLVSVVENNSKDDLESVDLEHMQ